MKLKEHFSTIQELAVLKVACENSLKVYIKIMHKFNTGINYVFKPFHEEIIKALEDIANYKNTKNLLINMPVGFGKSLLIQYFISWCFTRNRDNTFLYTSYSTDLINKHSSEIKNLMKGEAYKSLWYYDFKRDKDAKANWSIKGSSERSGLTAGAIGGTITGLDAGNPAIDGFCGAMIIDDPIKAIDVISDVEREKCVYKYNSVLKTRLRRSDVPTILIMQRLHEEDLSGWLLKNEPDNWTQIKIPALINEKSIWEGKITTKQLQDCRDKTPWVFYSQYQQDPNSNINTSFKGLHYATDEEEKLIENGFGHIDKGFDGEDGTAFCIIKKVGEYYYVLGKLWDKHIDDCMADIEVLRLQHKCGTIRTENNDDKGYLAKNNKFIFSYHEKQNKHFKIMTFLYPTWKKIKFLKGTDISYIKQIQHYNEKAKHDDSPDNLASIIRFLKSNYTKLIGRRPF